MVLPPKCHSRNRDLSKQTSFFQSSITKFLYPWRFGDSDSCFYLTGIATRVFFYGWSLTESKLDVLNSGRRSSAYVRCEERLFELLILSNQPELLSSDLFHQQRISVYRTAAHWNFLFLWSFSINPRDGQNDCLIIRVDQQFFFKYSDPPVQHQRPYCVHCN